MRKPFLLLIASLMLVTCEDEINITTPTILIEHAVPSVLDRITLKVEEYAEINGKRIEADYFDWLIYNSDGDTIDDDFQNSSTVIWVPGEAGYFLIKVKIGYDNNKSITAIREIVITESTRSLKKKIIGHWKGKGIRGYDGGEWGIDLVIEEDYHYYGYADFYGFDPYCDKGVFLGGRVDYWHGPNGGIGSYHDSCGVPGNILCQKIEILEIEDNTGVGKMWYGMVNIWTDFIDTSCYDVKFNNLTADDKNLYFEFPDGSEIPATKVILEKQ